MGSTSSSPRCHEGRAGEHCPEHNPCCYCHKPTDSESSSPEGDGELSDVDTPDLCQCGCAREGHPPLGCPEHGFHAFALPHVHEWGDWAPDKLQPRNGLEYAWCPCGASKARRAEPEESDESPKDDDLCRCGHWRVRHRNGSCRSCGLIGLHHASIHDFIPAEPEEVVCVCGHPEGDHRAGLSQPYSGCNWCKKERCGEYRPEPGPDLCTCHGDGEEPCPWHQASTPEEPPAPRRRPPYAVAYAVEGGALYEVALSGDATVVAEDGVLQIIHPSRAVLGITRVTPMYMEERSADDGAQ